MADKVIVIKRDGDEHIVDGKDFDPVKYDGLVLRCAGEFRGKECRALVEPARGPKGVYYFRLKKTDKNRHVKYCPYDETGEFETVKNLDVDGKSTTLDKIYSKLSKGAAETKATGGIGKIGGAKAYGSDEQEDPSPKILIQEKKPPQNLKELYKAFSILKTHDTFGKDSCIVKDHVIDERTVSGYRKRGIKEGAIMLTVGKRTAPGNYVRVKGGLVTLEDAYRYEKQTIEPIYYVLQARTKADADAIRPLLYDNKNKTDRFLVFSKWTKYDAAGDRYYISEPLTKKQVEKVDEEFLKSFRDDE